MKATLAPLTRREFPSRTATLAATPLLGSLAARAAASGKRTHADQVPLGRTGLTCSRLGLGTGSHSGNVQKALGKEAFVRLVRYAYDQGITYIDCAQSYVTFDWIGEAIKGLPRDRLFVPSKIGGQPEDILAAIDRHRRIFHTDHLDRLRVHRMVKDRWADDWKRIQDGFDEAQQRHWICLKGAPATACRRGARSSNRPGRSFTWSASTPMAGTWTRRPELGTPVATPRICRRCSNNCAGGASRAAASCMQLGGDGEFTRPEDREAAMQYAMRSGLVDAVVIGFKSTAKIDESIARMHRALAAA